jgi:hypothetical protein
MYRITAIHLSVFLLTGLASCDKPAQEVLLRFAPQVGHTYTYAFSVNLDKTTYGRLHNEKLGAIFSIHVLGKEKGVYHTEWDIKLTDSNLSKGLMDSLMDRMRDRPMESLEQDISDRYVFASAGEQNLCFPEEPVRIGEGWIGECLFHFGDLMTLKPPMIKVVYRLVSIDTCEDGICCGIECEPVERVVEVPFQIGQLGLRCDADGLVTAVSEHSDAKGKIETGDQLVAINGKVASTREDRNVLAERYVEPLRNIGGDIQLTVLRDGKKHEIVVKKTFITMGAMRVEIKDALRKVLFNQSRGIVIFETTDAKYAVTYHFLDDLPFWDNYTGRPFIKKDAGTEIPPRMYEYAMKMSFIKEEIP